MSSPRMITLFTQWSEPGRRPTSLALSIVLHFFLGAILWFSINYTPPFRRVMTDHLAIRELDLRTPDEQLRASKEAIPYPTQPLTAPASASPRAAPGHSAPQPAPPKSETPPAPAAPAADQTPPSPPAPPHIDQVKPGPQTLVQADLPDSIALKEQIPVPQVMIWSPSKTPVTKIVPPPPQKQPAADVKPSLAKPSPETNLGDINLSSTDHPAPAQPVRPSTTSPIAVPSKQPVQSPPVTVSQPAAPPTPAAILSLSDVRAKSSTTILPAVSEAVASKNPAPPSPAQGKNPSPAPGNAAPSAKPGTGTKQISGTNNAAAPSNSAGTASKIAPSGKANASAAPGANTQPKTPGNGTSSSLLASGPKPEAIHPAVGLDTELNSVGQPAVTQISLPKDGHFGAVIVGNSLEDQYPEIAGIWHGRVTYTAYLHVGLAKSWILQYSLPRPAETSDGGTVAHLEAPWPYNIVRPNLPPDSLDADALMVHGFVNASGHFETLSVAFPESFSQTQFVLKALQQWLFRPALLDGQAARVEVLLIIPDTYE